MAAVVCQVVRVRYLDLAFPVAASCLPLATFCQSAGLNRTPAPTSTPTSSFSRRRQRSAPAHGPRLRGNEGRFPIDDLSLTWGLLRYCNVFEIDAPPRGLGTYNDGSGPHSLLLDLSPPAQRYRNTLAYKMFQGLDKLFAGFPGC